MVKGLPAQKESVEEASARLRKSRYNPKPPWVAAPLALHQILPTPPHQPSPVMGRVEGADLRAPASRWPRCWTSWCSRWRRPGWSRARTWSGCSGTGGPWAHSRRSSQRSRSSRPARREHRASSQSLSTADLRSPGLHRQATALPKCPTPDMCGHPSVCLSTADLQSPGLHGRATALPKCPSPGHVWTPECVPLRCRPVEPGPPRASYRPSQVPCPRTRVDTRMCEQSCRQHWSDIVFDKHGEAWEMSNS